MFCFLAESLQLWAHWESAQNHSDGGWEHHAVTSWSGKWKGTRWQNTDSYMSVCIIVRTAQIWANCLHPRSCVCAIQLLLHCFLIQRILQTSFWFIAQMMGLLQHLKSHRRISPPTDLESSYLLENCLEPTALSNTRLPFHLLFQTSHAFWKIVCVYLVFTVLLISPLLVYLFSVCLILLFIHSSRAQWRDFTHLTSHL